MYYPLFNGVDFYYLFDILLVISIIIFGIFYFVLRKKYNLSKLKYIIPIVWGIFLIIIYYKSLMSVVIIGAIILLILAIIIGFGYIMIKSNKSNQRERTYYNNGGYNEYYNEIHVYHHRDNHYKPPQRKESSGMEIVTKYNTDHLNDCIPRKHDIKVVPINKNRLKNYGKFK